MIGDNLLTSLLMAVCHYLPFYICIQQEITCVQGDLTADLWKVEGWKGVYVVIDMFASERLWPNCDIEECTL